jgi:class 3 adenylate cyclase
MGQKTEQLMVLFADICSSTSYFRKYGDATGRRIVMDCLSLAIDTITGLGGKIVDRIGDEILCTNPNLESGLKTGPAIQESIADAAASGKLPAGLTMRIGFHYGPVVIDGDRIYGDTIHTAKRLVDLAKCDQILTSRDTLSAAPVVTLPTSRFVDRIRIKGQSNPVEIFELLRETSDLTQTAAPLHAVGESYKACLLTYRHEEIVINEARPVLTIGRVPPCDIAIPQGCVSRQHARVEYQKGRIIVVDHSTNGTFLTENPSKKSILVRREQRWLRNTGALRFGRMEDPDGSLTLVYVCI